MSQEYYFSQLNKGQQEAYRNMQAGFEQISSEFQVRRLDNRELSDVFFLLRLDHPELFYISSFQYRYSQESQYVKLIPEYMFEKKKIREHQKALEGRIGRLVRQMKDMSPEEKEMFIHDFICDNVTYDKLKKQYSHEIIGPLQQGVGVCEGIAKTVKILCDQTGMECIVAISQANPEAGVRYRHAWNVIKLGKSWYHLDATFDNSLGRYGTKRFDYFDLDDKKVFEDHQPLMYPVPSCGDGARFYYLEKRLSLTKVEEIGKRIKAVLRKKQDYFVFHWRGGGLNRRLLEEIYQEASSRAMEKGRYAALSVNLSQSVIEVKLSEQRIGEVICQEEANEGETA